MTFDVSNNGTVSRLEQSINIERISVTFDVLNNGTVSRFEHPKNMQFLDVTFDVSNNTIEIKELHPSNIDDVSVTLDVSPASIILTKFSGSVNASVNILDQSSVQSQVQSHWLYCDSTFVQLPLNQRENDSSDGS